MWIRNGILRGFHIGFSHTESKLRSSLSNMLSATDHPQIVTNYIEEELASQHLLLVGPSSALNLSQVHISPLGIIKAIERIQSIVWCLYHTTSLH